MSSQTPAAALSIPLATVILAAGHGKRMNSATPKVLHEIGGRSLLAHVMDRAQALSPQRRAVVIGDQGPALGEAARGLDPDVFIGVQAPPRGTGDAVMQAAPAFEDFDGCVLVLYADTPFVRPETMAALAGEIERGAACAVLGFRHDPPGGYGRLKLNADGALEAIVEAKDASPDELQITLLNAGVMAFDAGFLRESLPQLSPDNAQKEYYLTDLVAIARGEGRTAGVVEAPAAEVAGVNARAELAAAEAAFQADARAAAMAAGVTLIDPQTVYFSFDTEIAPDVVIEPNVFFGPGVRVEAGAVVKAFSHIEGAHIGADAQVGPFARLRPGAHLGPDVRVGNFVELKKADIGPGAKVSHLTYLGDAAVGANANIGAGTISCNYDGYNKHRTEIGENAFIGSNSALVAPVKIGAGAYVGSGSVITRDVEPDALAVARGRQADIPGWGARFRKAHKDDRDAE